MSPTLGRITRIDRPSAGLFALTLRQRGDTEVLLLGLRAPAFGAGLVPTRPRGAAADSFAQGLRRRLEGAELLGVLETDEGLAFALRPREGDDDAGATPTPATERAPWWLILTREKGSLTLLARGDVLLTTHPAAPTPRPPEEGADARLLPLELRLDGPRLLNAEAENLIRAARRELGNGLERASKRLARKRKAIEADAARAEGAPGLRLDADLLLTHATSAQREADGSGWLAVQDWSEEPPRERRITLERGERPAERAAKLYHQAKRLERGARIAEERWALVEAQFEQVSELARKCALATSLAALDALWEDARSLGVRELESESAGKAEGPRRPHTRAGAKKKAERGRSPFRRFVGSGGHAIWVGRSARENDALTLHHAKPHHLWLHVEGRAGSHVILPMERGAAIPSELLVDAGHLAAHFSDARDESSVEVIYAERRHVVKPRGYPAGAVRVDRRKTLLLRREPGRLEALLASERRI